MNCTTCGANLPPGATACPLCGTPTPYNAGRPGSSPQYDPTVAVPQAGPGGSPHQDPTLPAQPYGGTPPPPSTAYGSPGMSFLHRSKGEYMAHPNHPGDAAGSA
ncbi:MAG: hypothetical protein E6J11_10045 [Chloroflexi bacterium]|nr:MAG: hypothetical protein E6J11_10045 [Chloroflexota bacterium]